MSGFSSQKKCGDNRKLNVFISASTDVLLAWGKLKLKLIKQDQDKFDDCIEIVLNSFRMFTTTAEAF